MCGSLRLGPTGQMVLLCAASASVLNDAARIGPLVIELVCPHRDPIAQLLSHAACSAFEGHSELSGLLESL